jgi:hypothetical protein
MKEKTDQVDGVVIILEFAAEQRSYVPNVS